jgi:uncharacterized protein
MQRYVVFSGFDQLAKGSLAEVYSVCRDRSGAVIFDQQSGRVVDIDPRFPPDEEVAKPGRPKMGVVAREVTLLPLHWDWLATQPGGASFALRKLVEEASRDPGSRKRLRRDAVFRFATALVGNAPAYEEAMRALYGGYKEDFLGYIEGWPRDVRTVLEEMTMDAF